MVNSSLLDSILPSEMQIAPVASQSVVAGSTMVTSLLEFGLTCISHLAFPPFSSRFALTTLPPVTVNAWSRRVLKLKLCLSSSLNRSSKVNFFRPSWESGAPWMVAVSGCVTAAVASLVSDSSLPASSVKVTLTLRALPTSPATTV